MLGTHSISPVARETVYFLCPMYCASRSIEWANITDGMGIEKAACCEPALSACPRGWRMIERKWCHRCMPNSRSAHHE